VKIRTSLPATRRRRIRILSGAFVSMLAIGGLAACGSSSGGSSSQSSNGKVTLNLFECQECIPFPWQVSAFEKAYPKIHINVDSVPFGEFYTKTAVLAASTAWLSVERTAWTLPTGKASAVGGAV